MASTQSKDSPMFIATANALAGATGGMIAITIVFPLDVCQTIYSSIPTSIYILSTIQYQIIRTQLQAQATESTQSIKLSSSKSSQLISSPHPNIDEEEIDDTKQQQQQKKNASFIIKQQQNGITDIIKQIYRKEGIHGFYRALSSQLICIFVSDIVYFFAVTLIKQVLYGKREVDAISNLKASSIAGIVNVFLTSPFWRAQVQLMLQSKQQKQKEENEYITKGCDDVKDEEEEPLMNGLCDAWKRIFAQDGIAGLYKGIGPSLWLVSNPIIQFVAYEEIVNVLKRWQGNNQLSALTYFICGALGKAIATFATYPLQVMQTQLRRKDSPFTDMQDCVKNFLVPKLKNGDIAPLFMGLSAKLYQTVSNSAIKFMVYEEVIRVIVVLMRYLQKA